MNSEYNDHNYSDILKKIAKLCSNKQCKKPLILAVSKKQPIEKIIKLYQLGHRDFGENYLSEALEKQVILKDLVIIWHFIGHIQSRQAKDIAQHFSWIHSLDRIKVAKKLDQYATKKLNVCIQLNISNESTKSGIEPKIEIINRFIYELQGFENLVIRGLMIIPAINDNMAFVRTKEIFEQVKSQHNLVNFDTLSMGMSTDYENAIKSGSTIIRIGTAIFGIRLN